jgi:O-antigen ligase
MITLLFTGSRFVILAFPVALVLLEWRRIKAYAWQILCLLLVSGGILWWEGSVTGRFAELFDPSIPFSVRWSRVVYWQVHWRVFVDHPWFGVTMAGMKETLKQYWPVEYASLEILPAHNIFLQTLADSGVLGALGLIGFLISFWISSRRARRVLGRSSGLEWMLTLTIIVGLVQNNLRDSEYLMALWYLSSVLIVRAALVSLGRGDESVKMN